MKGMHGHYKEMLSELDKCYNGIEQDIHRKYKDFIEKWKAQMNKKCLSLKTAYDEEHKLREELRTWAELNMISLQEKVKELSDDKKKALERLDLVMVGGSKELDTLKKSLDQEYQGKMDKLKAEKLKLEMEAQVLDAKAKSRSTEIAGLIVELILKNVESKILPVAEVVSVPGKKPTKIQQASADEANKLREEIAKLKKDLQAANKASPIPKKPAEKIEVQVPIPDPVIIQERDILKKKVEEQELNYKKMLAEMASERDSLQRELQIYSANIAAPSESDDNKTLALKNQLALLAAEMSASREKIGVLEGENSQIKLLQESILKKNEEISKRNEEVSEVQASDVKIQPNVLPSQEIKAENIEKLNEEILSLKNTINELTMIPAAVSASKPGDDKEKKELRSMLKKLQKHNQVLKDELEQQKNVEANSDEVSILRINLEEAKEYIKQLESGNAVVASKEGPVKGKQPKVSKDLNEKLKIAHERIAQLESSSNVEDLEKKIALANQQIEFLQTQLNGSGKPPVKFPTEEIAKLNEEVLQANKRIQNLTDELNAKGEGNNEELLAEIALLKSENQTFRSNDKSGQLNDLNGKVKNLTEELKQRPTKDDVAKLNEVINAKEKQLKESSSSQSSQIKTLNDQIAQLNLENATKIKDMEMAAAAAAKQYKDALTKISQQLADLEKVREQLENKLKAEIDTKGKMQAELDKLRKVVGEAAILTKKVEEMTAIVATLQEKNQAKEQELKDSLRQRKLLHNQLEDLKGKIRVFCRVRPLSNSEIERGCGNITTIVDEFTITCDSKSGIKPFVYDSVFGPNSSQEEVFEDTKRVVQSAIDGYNVCVFAYGQTGSGKTFTMQGTENFPGVTPRAMDELFNLLNGLPSHYKYQVSCYMVELYLDVLVDLFLPKDFKGNPPALSIKKDIKGIVVIPETTIFAVKSAKEIMTKFDEGNLMRHTSSTKMNDMSSRSHLIFGVMIDVTNTETNQRTVGKLSLVDLAGSERVSKTEATAERLKEGRAINKSLSALGDVISALSSNDSHIPYRNNKLTMLMSDSLGGTAKTLMFVNISPASYNLEETTMSLYYAARVKLITNDPSKNIESKDMSNLKQELLMISSERDKYKAALEKNGFNISALEDIPESRQEDFDDAKYDDL